MKIDEILILNFFSKTISSVRKLIATRFHIETVITDTTWSLWLHCKSHVRTECRQWALTWWVSHHRQLLVPISELWHHLSGQQVKDHPPVDRTETCSSYDCTWLVVSHRCSSTDCVLSLYTCTVFTALQFNILGGMPICFQPCSCVLKLLLLIIE